MMRPMCPTLHDYILVMLFVLILACWLQYFQYFISSLLFDPARPFGLSRFFFAPGGAGVEPFFSRSLALRSDTVAGRLEIPAKQVTCNRVEL